MNVNQSISLPCHALSSAVFQQAKAVLFAVSNVVSVCGKPFHHGAEGQPLNARERKSHNRSNQIKKGSEAEFALSFP